MAVGSTKVHGFDGLERRASFHFFTFLVSINFED